MQTFLGCSFPSETTCLLVHIGLWDCIAIVVRAHMQCDFCLFLVGSVQDAACELSFDVFWPFLPTLLKALASTQHSQHFFFGWELAFPPAAVCVTHLCMCWVSAVRGNGICDPMRQKGKVCFSITAFSPFVEMWAHCVDHPHFPSQ